MNCDIRYTCSTPSPPLAPHFGLLECQRPEAPRGEGGASWRCGPAEALGAGLMSAGGRGGGGRGPRQNSGASAARASPPSADASPRARTFGFKWPGGLGTRHVAPRSRASGHVPARHQPRGRRRALALSRDPRGSRDGAGAARPHVTGAAGRRVSFLPRAPQRPGFWIPGPSVALTPAPGPPARLPPAPARPPALQPPSTRSAPASAALAPMAALGGARRRALLLLLLGEGPGTLGQGGREAGVPGSAGPRLGTQGLRGAGEGSPTSRPRPGGGRRPGAGPAALWPRLELGRDVSRRPVPLSGH